MVSRKFRWVGAGISMRPNRLFTGGLKRPVVWMKIPEVLYWWTWALGLPLLEWQSGTLSLITNGSKRVFRSNFHGWKFVYIEKWTLPQKNCKNITPNRKLSKSNVKHCSQSNFICSLALHHRFSASKTSLKVGDNAINSDKMYANHSFYDVNVERPSQTMFPMGKLTKATFPMCI